MTRNTFTAFLALISISFAAAPLAFGQAAAMNGQILGTVTDPTGAVVASAQVTVTNKDTGLVQKAETASSGLYRFNILPLGTYSVSVEAAGFGTTKRDGIVLNAGATVTIDVALSVQGVSSEVVVEAAGSVIDPSRTDQGSTLNSAALANLPSVSRNPFNFILQQPNVTGRGNTEFGVPRKVNANGFNGRINYQVDGSNNVQSDRAGIRLMPISDTWVEEVQQVSNGFAPEFGNTVGTVFNSITKSGVNDLHGEASYFFRRTDFSARPALLRDSQPTPDVNVNGGFADGGGRIIRDKLFWFGSYEKVKRDLPAPVTVPSATLSQLGLPDSYGNAIPFNQNVTFFLAKVDWQISSAHRLSLRYNGHRNDSPYNSSSIGGQYLIDRTYNFQDRSHGGAAQLISSFGGHAVNELRVQIPYRSQQQNRFSGTGTGPAISIAGVAFFGNSLDVGFNYEETTPEVSDNFSYNLNTHSFKVGYNIRSIRDTYVQPTFANYTFPNVAAYLDAKNGVNLRGYSNFTQTLGNPSMDYTTLFNSVYAQDSWKPRSNITVIYGVRYDIYRPPSANANAPFAYSQSFRTDKNNVAPRLGIAWGLGKTVIRASGGIFYDPFATDTYRLALLNNGSPAFFRYSKGPSDSFAPSFPNVFSGIPAGLAPQNSDITTVSPDFASLYSANANFSVSREFARNLGVTATYLYTRGNRLPVWRNINVVPSGQFLADGRPIFSSTARNFTGFANILSAESVGQSVYNGLNLTVTKRYSRGFQLFATYTWSHAIDDAPEQNNIDSGAFLLSDPTNRSRDRANSLTDRRHAFNSNLLYESHASFSNRLANYLANHNMIALTGNIQSGELFNMGSNQYLNNDQSTATAYQRPLYIGRNTIRAPRTVELNARYTRTFPIRERMNAQFWAESTNILNRTNVTGLNATATTNLQGRILTPAPLTWTGALDQRLLQFGLRFNF